MPGDADALLAALLSGQSYRDVAELLGDHETVVRTRARSALQALDGQGELPADVADGLLGQGSSGSWAGRSPDPSLGSRIDRLRAELGRIAPGVDVPAPAASAGGPGVDPGDAEPDRRVLLGLSLVGVAVLLVVLAVSGVFGGSGSGTDAGGDRADPAEDLVLIPLKPVGGTKARGEIRLIRVADLPALALTIEGLQPSPAGQTYLVWLYDSAARAFPVGFRDVGPNGRIRGEIALPAVATALLPGFDFIDISLTSDADAQAAIKNAGPSGIPAHAGESVLRGSLRVDQT